MMKCVEYRRKKSYYVIYLAANRGRLLFWFHAILVSLCLVFYAEPPLVAFRKNGRPRPKEKVTSVQNKTKKNKKKKTNKPMQIFKPSTKQNVLFSKVLVIVPSWKCFLRSPFNFMFSCCLVEFFQVCSPVESVSQLPYKLTMKKEAQK